MRKTWVEVTCNGCGWASHYPHPTTNKDLQREGYIVLKGRLHFCSEKCKHDYFKRVTYGEQND